MHTMDKERRSIFDRFGLNRNRAGNPGETDTGNPDEKRRRKKARLIVGLSIILLAVAGGMWSYSSGLFREDPDMLLVTSGDKIVIWRPLKDISDGTIPVEGPLGTTIVDVRQGRVRVLSSPCPEHICMNTGWISKTGQIIVCMPNRIVVRLVKKPS